MKLIEKEAINLLFVRDICQYSVNQEMTESICKKCPFYEGYCHFRHYLKTCLEKGEG